VKVDQQIINNLNEAEQAIIENRYNVIDNIILMKCVGCKNISEVNNETVGSLRFWLADKIRTLRSVKNVSKVKLLIDGIDDNALLWRTWQIQLQNDLYREFLFNRGYRFSLINGKFELRLVKSMSEVTEENNPGIDQWFMSEVNSWGDGVKVYIDDSLDKRPFPELEEVEIKYTRVFKQNMKVEISVFIKFILNESNIEYGIYKVNINPIFMQNFKPFELGTVNMVGLEQFTYLNRYQVYDTFISKIRYRLKMEYLSGLAGLGVNGRYNMLLELYTGYLKYGSVDNYIKYCQEDDERVALNTKIA
jgi:hypothetical protein